MYAQKKTTPMTTPDPAIVFTQPKDTPEKGRLRESSGPGSGKTGGLSMSPLSPPILLFGKVLKIRPENLGTRSAGAGNF